MAVQITVRNVPDLVRDTLADKARHERKSMQEYLLGELERLAGRPSPAQWLARARRRKAKTGTRLPPSEILAHRDADRR
jgi:antitoxin FitA